MTQFWEPVIGKAFAIDNKDGASGITGVRYFMSPARRRLHHHGVHRGAFTAALEKTDTFALTDIEVINVHQFDPSSFTVLAGRFKTFDELIAEAKAKPNSI